MDNTKKTIISIGITLMIIVLVSGATFAYWSWISGENTTVTFTVSAPEISVSMTGSGVITAANMEPTICTNTEDGNNIRENVVFTYKNPTPYPVTVSVDLYATNFTTRTGVSTIATDKLQKFEWRLTESSSSCATNSDDLTAINTNFSGLTITDGSLAAETKLGTVSFEIPANTISELTKTLYLYVWLDSSYEHQNVGSVNSDPVQGATFTLKWQNGTAIQHTS